MSKNDCTKIQKHAEIAEVTFDPPRSAIFVCLCKTIKSSKSNKFIVKNFQIFISKIGRFMSEVDASRICDKRPISI